MSTRAKLPPLSLPAISLLALVALTPNAVAQNIFTGFTKAPTFTPPSGCVPSRRTYGVVSRCEKTIGPGRYFWVSVNYSVGGVGGGDAAFFVKDHVAEAKAWWRDRYPRNNLTFSSRAANFTPRNAPQGTSCIEYSISVEATKAIDGRSVPVKQRVEGLTCAWPVGRHAGGNWNVELFWLEAGDEYAPSLGQKPMDSFDVIVRKLFASARL